ncbi:MAG TPA: metallopeptidase TldD-related protein [Casimicrobiaceae bacterium]|nr:metallopeptidase TldD-related protein [Casimicrobiaceae bacterium]
MAPREPMPACGAVEAYFHDLAATLDDLIVAGETYLARFSAEASDFVRLNRGRVRQPGSVVQRFLDVELVRGTRHATQRLSLSGRPEADRALLTASIAALRTALADLQEDPHLLYSTEVRSSHEVRGGPLPPAETVIETVLAAADGVDLVGIYAGGPVYRGFANSLGQRNWHEVTSFSLQWSLYHRADKAVKTGFSGFEWNEAEFAAKMAGARERLALLAQPSRTLTPGNYRAYLTPSAMEEIGAMLCWGGFSGRAQKTKQSCLFRLRDGAAVLDPSIGFSEDTAHGMAPSFQDEGFTRPASVPLVVEGKMASSLVSPRTAREFELSANGANGAESPESLDMAAGKLPTANVLAALDTGIYVGNLWYLNFSDRPACRLTGMTRFACFWVEKGKIIAPVDVMRFDDSVFRLFGEQLVALTAERELLASSDTYRARSVSSMCLPGAVVRDMAFTL